MGKTRLVVLRSRLVIVLFLFHTFITTLVFIMITLFLEKEGELVLYTVCPRIMCVTIIRICFLFGIHTTTSSRLACLLYYIMNTYQVYTF